MAKRVDVAGVGCCLVDFLYNKISFRSETFSKFLSQKSGDGGLTPGQLVFTEEFEKFSGQNLDSFLSEITKGKKADTINIGGPGIVALIHAAQMLEGRNCRIQFYGACGSDEAGNYLQNELKKFPVNTMGYISLKGSTPSTVVLSDPAYHAGAGERIFINSIGAACNYFPRHLDSRFFSSDVVVFGGTALVPVIHDNLTELLLRAKRNGSITVVNTVYDFRNQKMNPLQKWPLGKSDDSYANIDLLVTNREEALRLSGKSTVREALVFFAEQGTKAGLITGGTENVLLFATGKGTFLEQEPFELPVSDAISEDLNKGTAGDTTGCGDNFAGGVIASIVMQLQDNRKLLDIREAASWGIVSGGFSCFYLGGTYHQNNPGEKQEIIKRYYERYMMQAMNE